MEYYLIKKGDTLSAIAKQFYGKANDYPRIFEDNREVIKDPTFKAPLTKLRSNVSSLKMAHPYL